MLPLQLLYERINMKMKDNCISNKYYVTFPVTSQLGDYYVIIQCSNFSKCTEIARKYFSIMTFSYISKAKVHKMCIGIVFNSIITYILPRVFSLRFI